MENIIFILFKRPFAEVVAFCIDKVASEQAMLKQQAGETQRR